MVSSAQGRLNADVRQRAQWSVLCTAVKILHRAWPDVVKDSIVSSSPHEDKITDVLRRRMSDIKKSMQPRPAMRFERESQSDAAEDDTELGLIDIMVCYTWNEQTYLVIECKRISSSDNSLAKKYVEQGVARFASGKYSAGHAYGVMVGYVLCGAPKKCTAAIRDELTTASATLTGYDSDHGWKLTKRIDKAIPVGLTRHSQSGHRFKISLVHSTVEF